MNKFASNFVPIGRDVTGETSRFLAVSAYGKFQLLLAGFHMAKIFPES